MINLSEKGGQDQILQTLVFAAKDANHEAIIAGGNLLRLYQTTTGKIDRILSDLHVSDVTLPSVQEETSPEYQATEALIQKRIQQADPLAITVGFGKLYEGYMLGVTLTVMRLEEATQGSRAREEVPQLVQTLDGLAQIRATVEQTLENEAKELSPTLTAIEPYAANLEKPKPTTAKAVPINSIWMKVHEGFVVLANSENQQLPPKQPQQQEMPPTTIQMSQGEKELVDLGEFARRYRFNANWTQREVAEKLRGGEGASVSYLSAIERGTIRPSPQMLEDLMQILRIPEDDKAIMRRKLGTM